jgi:hypothetical protein
VAATASLGEVYLDTFSRQVSSGTGQTLGYNRSTGENAVQTYGATVNQTLFNGFQTGNRTRQAEAQVLSARELLRTAEQTVLLNAVTAYMNLLRDTAILELQRSNVTVLEATLRQNGIDPLKDVKLNNNVAIPARVGSWIAGQNQYAIFIEPDASQLEIDGKAHFLASIGQTVGPADYTTFMATDKYIKEHPDVIQTFTDVIYRAQKWTASQPAADVAKAIAEFFPGVNPQALVAAAERYRKLNIWKDTPKIDPKAIDKFQDILVQGNVLSDAKRVKYEKLVLTEFANKAK